MKKIKLFFHKSGKSSVCKLLHHRCNRHAKYPIPKAKATALIFAGAMDAKK
jgi:hypothetical protein